MDGEFLIKTDLKKRGWTDSLVQRFLPEPDETRVNPHYRSGPPMRLYRLKRVKSVEKRRDFQAALAKATQRRKGAKSGVETKRKKTMTKIEGLQIKVARFSRKELIRRACESYNNRNIERPDASCATPRSESDFLERICVNYLRHEATEYDSHLDGTSGAVGKSAAYDLLKEHVLDAIAEEYPWLSPECMRQSIQIVDREVGR